MYGMPAGHLAFCIEIEGHHSAVYFNCMNLQDFNEVFLLTFTLINCATNIIIDKVKACLNYRTPSRAVFLISLSLCVKENYVGFP